jgi:hypothetical protein
MEQSWMECARANGLEILVSVIGAMMEVYGGSGEDVLGLQGGLGKWRLDQELREKMV